MIQNAWDERRESQVRTYTQLSASEAIQCFQRTILKVILKHKDESHYDANGKFKIFGIYGSYDYTHYKINGESMNNEIKTFISQLGRSEENPITKILRNNKMWLICSGTRVTGTIHYEDGTFDVINPLTGLMINGKTVKSIKPIETLYCYITYLE